MPLMEYWLLENAERLLEKALREVLSGDGERLRFRRLTSPSR